MGRLSSFSCFVGNGRFNRNLITAAITIITYTNFIIIAIRLIIADESSSIAVIKFKNFKELLGLSSVNSAKVKALHLFS